VSQALHYQKELFFGDSFLLLIVFLEERLYEVFLPLDELGFRVLTQFLFVFKFLGRHWDTNVGLLVFKILDQS